MANPNFSIVPPTMTESETEDMVHAMLQDDASESLAGVLDTMESPIPSPTAEGSPHHGRESVTQVPESPADSILVPSYTNCSSPRPRNQ